MNHSEARAILSQAFRQVHGRAPSSNELSLTQAVAWLENQYGRAGQFAAFAADGEYNWGSLHARGTPPDCPPGSRAGSDVGRVCFQVFGSDQAAAVAFVRTLTQRSGVLAAMNQGPDAVAHAMKATGYYEAPEATYAAALRRSVSATGGAVSGASSSSGTWLLLLAAAGAGYYAHQKGWLRLPSLKSFVG